MDHRTALEGLSGECINELHFGIPELDEMYQFFRGDLVIVGGPAHGAKTLATSNLILENPGVKILWFTPDETHSFVLEKLIKAKEGMSNPDFRREMQDPNGFDYLANVASEVCESVIISEESSPQRIQAIVNDAASVLGGLDVIVFDYVEYLEMPTDDVSRKMVWLKDLARDTNAVMFAIHQSNKMGLDPQVRPHMGLLSGAGHKEAFQILWCKREYVDPLNPIAVAESRNQAAMEIWMLKNKRGERLDAPIRCAIEKGGKVVQWTKHHTDKARGQVPRF